MIRQIEKEELRKMHGREGLVLQGCGGELKEWTDGINQMLEQAVRELCLKGEADLQSHRGLDGPGRMGIHPQRTPSHEPAV